MLCAGTIDNHVGFGQRGGGARVQRRHADGPRATAFPSRPRGSGAFSMRCRYVSSSTRNSSLILAASCAATISASFSKRRAVFLFRYQEKILAAGDVEQHAAGDFVEIAESFYGAIEVLVLLQVASGKEEIAEGAIGEVERAAELLLLVEIRRNVARNEQSCRICQQARCGKAAASDRAEPHSPVQHAVERGQASWREMPTGSR